MFGLKTTLNLWYKNIILLYLAAQIKSNYERFLTGLKLKGKPFKR